MKDFVRVLAISFILVTLVFLMYAPPFAEHPWLEAQGMSEEELPPFQTIPFLLMFVGWVMYSHLFRWLYSGMKLTGWKDALLLGGRLWLFIAFPVIAIHYLFLELSWILIMIDSFSQLVAMIAGALLLWGWTLHPTTTENK